MATAVMISDQAKAAAEQLVHDGRYATIDEAVEAGVIRLKLEIDDEDFDLSPEDLAAIDEGLADIEAGRTIPAEEVFAELRARFGAAPR